MRPLPRLPGVPSLSRWPWAALATAGAVACAAALGVAGALHYLRPGVLLGDTVTHYLPDARAFLAQGFRFLADPRSLEVGPLSYLYPALFGAEPERVKVVNVGLYALLFLPVYRTGRLLHSRTAGVAAAFAFAAMGDFQIWVPTLYTEFLFVALLVVWSWAVAELTVARRGWAVPVAGVALGLAMLTRGTPMFYAAALAAAGLGLGWRGPEADRAAWRGLGFSALIALVFPAAVSLKNLLVFGDAALYTGTGISLYLGSHPLTDGLDPRWHLGAAYDTSELLGGLPRLGPEGNALLKAVGIEMLLDRGPLGIASHLAHQTGRILFGTTATSWLDFPWFNLRTFRIVALVLGVFGLPALRSRVAGWVFATAAAYVVAVQAPLLYLPRYAMPVEVWLVPLGAVGAARGVHALLQGSRRQRLAAAGVAVAALALVAAGEWDRRTTLGPHPRILEVPRVALARIPAGAPGVVRQVVTGAQESEGIPAAPAILFPLRGVTPERGPMKEGQPTVTSLGLTVGPPAGGPCDRATLLFQPAAGPAPGPDRAARFRIRSDGRPHRYDVGTFLLDLHGDGVLGLLLNCAPETPITVGEVTVWEDRVAAVYRARHLAAHERGAAP